MKEVPTIEKVMTRSPTAVDIKDPVVKAQKIMSEGGFRHVPVMESGKVVSIISDRDVNVAVAANKDLRAAESLLVEDVCTLNTYMVSPKTPLDQVVSYMNERHIGSVIVAGESGELHGIFTVTDACRLLGSCLRDEFKLSDG